LKLSLQNPKYYSKQAVSFYEHISLNRVLVTSTPASALAIRIRALFLIRGCPVNI
jgi:hypothetical protein